jgi:uncharacterized protein (DUF58 family)
MSARLNNLAHHLRHCLPWPDFSRRPVFNFISKRSGPFDGAVTLTRDRVYIVPTKAGVIFSLLLLTLLIGSINYEKNLGFVLTFLLTGIGNVLLLSSWRNLAGLQLKRGDSQAVFAGDDASFSVQLINKQLFDRYSIAIGQHGDEQDMVNCAANSTQMINFKVATNKRGHLNAGRFRLYTEFPSGLFIAWTWIDLSMSCLVYPTPDKNAQLPVFDHSEDGETDSSGPGLENFSHLRKYHQGDNLSRISWKAAAKSGELFSKEFTGSTPATHWINWNDIPARDSEQRLSIMAALIIHAEKNQQCYGIRLPEKQIAADSGHKHFHQCLTALALH